MTPTPDLVDSHAHLAEEAFDEDRREVLRRARQVGVETVVVIGYDATSSRRAIEVVQEAAGARSPVDVGSRAASADSATEEIPSLHATAGIAPHHVNEADAAALERVRAWLEAPEVVAVGEIGLEYHYDLPKAAQRKLFGCQLEWARQRDLPVIVHSREAEEDVLAILREHTGDGGIAEEPARLRGVLHCFTESTRMAEELVELGFYVSFAGILTFKNATRLRQTAARVPLERTLIETDSPYLVPAPHRGRRNEPAYVVEVARTLAEIHGRPAEEIASITADNARELFALRR